MHACKRRRATILVGGRKTFSVRLLGVDLPNKVGLKCPSVHVRPYVRPFVRPSSISFVDFNEIG